MPELPEVETIKMSLVHNLGAHIDQVEIRRADIIRRQDFELQELEGLAIKEIRRRGKFLVFAFPRRRYLVIHLGMSGRFYRLGGDEPAINKHVHLILHLDNHHKLVYEDVRRFGGVWLIHDIDAFFSRMGVEPLTDEFCPEYLGQILQRRQTPIKNLLLNQNLIAGIGNIYADEALFAAGIRPDRLAGSLSEEEIAGLCQAIKQVLAQSIEARGTTFRDYRDGLNQAGGFQHQLRVYGKNNQPCSCCGETIQKGKIAGRGTHFCEKCQQ